MVYENFDNIEYKKWEKDSNSLKDNLFRNLSILHILGFIAVCVLLNYLWKNNPEDRTLYFLILVGLVIFLIFMGKDKKKKEIIPEPVVQKICEDLIRSKIGYHKQLPSGSQFQRCLNSHLRWHTSDVTNESVPFRWDVPFLIKEKDGYIREHVAYFDPYKGICCGIVDSPTGFTGKESPNIKYVEKQFTLIDFKEEVEKS